jgi:hypothetical protein
MFDTFYFKIFCSKKRKSADQMKTFISGQKEHWKCQTNSEQQNITEQKNKNIFSITSAFSSKINFSKCTVKTIN